MTGKAVAYLIALKIDRDVPLLPPYKGGSCDGAREGVLFVFIERPSMLTSVAAQGFALRKKSIDLVAKLAAGDHGEIGEKALLVR